MVEQVVMAQDDDARILKVYFARIAETQVVDHAMMWDELRFEW